MSADRTDEPDAGTPDAVPALEEQNEVRSLLRGLSRESVPERFTGRVESRIRRRSRGRFFHNRWHYTGRTTYLGAAIVMVILAALYFFSQVAVEVRDARSGMTGEELRDAGGVDDRDERRPD